MAKVGKSLLSVIVACYNAQNYLPTFFNCLKTQTYKDFQVVLINDGSTDNTMPLIKDFCTNNPNAIYIDSTNEGVGSARAKGLALATGDFITFCDADDLIHPRHFEVLLSIMQGTDADMGVCSFKRVKESRLKGLKTNKKIKNKPTEVFDRVGAIQTYFSQKKFDFVLWNKIFRASTLKQTGATFLQGARYGEESYFIYNFLKGCKKVGYKGVKTYFYIQRKKSLMHVGFNPTRLDIFRNIDLVYEDCKTAYPTVSPYVNGMRAGYSVGMLYFMKKAKGVTAEQINLVLNYLKEDCPKLKKCKNIALYRRLFIPLVPPVAKLTFRKKLKAK